MAFEHVAEVSRGALNIQKKLVGSLESFPNVKPTLDGGTSIKIEEAFTIRQGHIGATKEGGPPDFNQEKKDEHEHGKEVVAGVEQLLQETFKGKNEFNIDNLAAEVFLRRSLILNDNLFKGNDELLNILGETDLYDITKKSVLPSKGVPVEIGRAITVAVANRLLKTVRESSTQEAETIDDKYVETQKPILQEVIGQLDESLQRTANELADRQEAYEQSEQEKARADESFANLDRNKVKAVDEISGKLKKPSTEISTDFSAEDLQFVKKEGAIAKKYSVKDGKFSRLDQEIKKIFGGTEDLESFDLQTDSVGDLAINTIEKLIDTHSPESSQDGDSLSLYSKAKNLLRDVLPNHDLDSVLEEQGNFFQKLNKSDQKAARSLAKGFLARAICLHLVKKPGKDINDSQLRPIIDRFSHGLTNFFEQTKKYKGFEEEKKHKEEIYEARKREWGETKHTHEQLEQNLTFNRRSLEELDTKRSERVDDLRAKMVAELFITTKGHVPSEEKFKKWHSYDLNNIVFQSRLLTDTVASIFKGLPICLPEGQEREFIIDNYLGPSYSSYEKKYVKEHFMGTVDYLPQLVKATLPENYPNPDLASNFITSMIRDYPNKKHNFGSLLGTRTISLDIFKEDRDNHYYNSITNETRSIIQAIMKGGEIVEIPTPKVNLQLLFDDDKWKGAKAIHELQTKADTLKKWLKDNAPSGSLVVPLELFIRPSKDDRYKRILKSDELLELDPESLFRNEGLLFFDNYLRTDQALGEKMASVFVIKATKLTK